MNNFNYQPCTISVVIPSFNTGQYLKEAIESVFTQSFQDYELIVVDDGSTDNTKEICEKYKDRLIYIYQENKGPASARNTGIRYAQGKFIALLDADDMFLPNKLERQIQAFEENPEIDCCYTQCYFCNENGVVYDTFLKNHRCPDDPLRYFVSVIFPATSSAIMVRKKCLFEIGLYDENLERCEDYDLEIRLASNCRFWYIDEPLVKIRHHSSNMSRSASPLLDHKLMIKVWQKNDHILSKLNCKYRWWLAKEYYGLGRQYFHMNCYKLARDNFRKAIKEDPEKLTFYFFWLFTLFPNRINQMLKKVNRFVRRYLLKKKFKEDYWWNIVQRK